MKAFLTVYEGVNFEALSVLVLLNGSNLFIYSYTRSFFLWIKKKKKKMTEETTTVPPNNAALMDNFLAAYETLEHEQKNKDKSKFVGLGSNVSFAEDVDLKNKPSASAVTPSGSSGSGKDATKKKESKHRRSKSESKKEDDDKPKDKSKSKKKKKSKETSSEESENSGEEEDLGHDPSIPVCDPILLAVPLKNPKSEYTEHQIILYRGADNHIHYMYSLDDEEWKHIDLTLHVSAPPASGSYFCLLFLL